MPFRARKLRVQLPCSVEGSIIDLADHGLENAPALAAAFFPFTCYLTALDYCACSVVHRTLPAGPACFDSGLASAPGALRAEESQHLVDPDLLPLLKKQLENRLAEIELAADAAKMRTQATLDDIAAAEQALRDRQVEDQPGA